MRALNHPSISTAVTVAFIHVDAEPSSSPATSTSMRSFSRGQSHVGGGGGGAEPGTPTIAEPVIGSGSCGGTGSLGGFMPLV